MRFDYGPGDDGPLDHGPIGHRMLCAKINSRSISSREALNTAQSVSLPYSFFMSRTEVFEALLFRRFRLQAIVPVSLLGHKGAGNFCEGSKMVEQREESHLFKKRDSSLRSE
jgi:hypothetical protein